VRRSAAKNICQEIKESRFQEARQEITEESCKKDCEGGS
jgi:hypothetical protein